MTSFWDSIKESFTSISESLGFAWWVEIVTQNPNCTYYFGPFLNSQEAEQASVGYVEDLELEGATGIVVTVKRCKPEILTIAEDLEGKFEFANQPVLSGQM